MYSNLTLDSKGHKNRLKLGLMRQLAVKVLQCGSDAWSQCPSPTVEEENSLWKSCFLTSMHAVFHTCNVLTCVCVPTFSDTCSHIKVRRKTGEVNLITVKVTEATTV